METVNTQQPFEMQTVSPNIFVRDIQQTITFYQTLGFEVLASAPDDKNPIFVLMQCGQINFMFQTFESIGDKLPAVRRGDGGSLLLYIKLKGIRKFFEQVKSKVTVLSELEKTFYGATEFSILDNNQYILTFAEDE